MQDPIHNQLLKFVGVLMAWFLSVNWGFWATVLATVYSALCIGEWIWKRIVKPIGQRYNIIPKTVYGDLNE